MNIQIFGLRNNSECRKAERFFAERRIKVHFVDLKVKPIAPGELRRFIERLGLPAIIDTDSKPYRDDGLQYLRLSPEQWAERLIAQPALLRLPLVRNGQQFTVGAAETEWKAWIAAG